MSMLIPGDKPDLRPHPASSSPGTSELEFQPPAIPGLQIFRWAILFVAGYMLFGALMLTAISFMAAIARPESGGLLAVFRHSPIWLVIVSWLPYLVGAIILNRRRHLAAWFLLGGAAIQLIPALRYNYSPIWTIVVISVPALVAILLLRQPDVRIGTPAAPARILSDLDLWSRRALVLVSAGYAAFDVYQYAVYTPTTFPLWLLVVPGVVAIAAIFPLGPYLLAIRLIPDDRRNAVILLAIGIAFNLLLALVGTRADLAVLPITVLVPAIIAVLQSRERGRDGS